MRATAAFTLALVGGCAQTTGETRGDAARAEDARAIDAPSSEASDADAVDAPPRAQGCGAVIDVAREGERVAAGYRVLVDLRRGGSIRLPAAAREASARFARALAFTASEAGIYAVYAPSAARIVRIAGCDPFVLAPTRTEGAPAEPLFDGSGRRFRLRAGETLLLAAVLEAPTLVVVSFRLMDDAARGERCDAVAGCDATSACRQDVCVAGGVEGASCDEADPPCDTGLRCIVDDRGARCARPVGAGASCGAVTPCAEGMGCVQIGVHDRCLVDGTVGGRCRETTAMRSACDAGLVCDGSRCRRAAAPGDACDALTRCPESARCASVAGVPRCVRPGELGADCRDAAPRCDDGLVCNVLSGRCAPPAAIGDRCGDHGATTCIGGRCEVGVCARTGGAGQACGDDGVCESGLACSGGRCVTPLAPGERCDANDDVRGCVDGRCLDGVCAPRSGRVGEACTTAGACGPGAYCDEARRCVALRGLGAACDGRGCASGLVCAAGRCAFASAEARACDAAGRCGAGRVCVAGECIAPGVCDRVRDARGPAPCDVERFCVGDDPRCVAAGALGSPCRSRGSPCDPGLVCNAWGVCARIVGVGEACGSGDECVEGSDCVPYPTGRETCVAAGREGGRCRSPFARPDACDPGLACATSVGRCFPAAGAGPCDATRICSEGSSCRRSGTPCVPDGIAGGACRFTAPRCDEGHACSRGFDVCIGIVRAGAGCDLATFSRCVDGTSCVVDDTGARRCLAARALGAYCSEPTSDDNGCDAGLACVARRCVMGVSEGGRCDPTDATKQCASGLVCVTDGSTGVCRRNGTEGTPCTGICRYPGYACNASLRCERVVGVGEACSDRGPRCGEGVCVSGRCVARGAEGGPCRGDAAPCDGELVCRGGEGDASRSTCQQPVPGVRYCLADGRVGCGVTESCVRGVCVADGAEGGVCRVARVPRCDTGLRCDGATARCVR